MAKRQRNLYFDLFAEKYEFHYRMPYGATSADFVQLDHLTNKAGKLSERLTLEVWARGVQNYFASELGAHSLKHLCSSFVPYWKQPLDRFGRPREKASQIGAAEPVQFSSWHPKFLHAVFKATQGRSDLFDAIDELFQAVGDGLSEVEAFKRLKEITEAK